MFWFRCACGICEESWGWLAAAVFPQGDGVDQSDPGTGTIKNKQTQSPSAQSDWIKNHA